jgi:hypothetical protein
MKHIKLFENWMDGEAQMPMGQPAEEETLNVPMAFADFHGELPDQSKLDSFGLRVGTLPNGDPRVDEYGYTLIGKIEDLEAFSQQMGNPIVTQGLFNDGEY